jgi:hypothetical protein
LGYDGIMKTIMTEDAKTAIANSFADLQLLSQVCQKMNKGFSLREEVELLAGGKLICTAMPEQDNLILVRLDGEEDAASGLPNVSV